MVLRAVLVGVSGLAVLGGVASKPGRAVAQEVPYGIGSWPEQGRGNHRAVVRVSQPADAVWVHIPWRRRDREPEKKSVLVFDAATGKQVMNVVRVNVKREFGDLVFQPATAPGDYEVYYLPYNPGVSNFDDPGTYFPPKDTAEPAWRQRNGLTAEGLAQGQWKLLPQVEVVQIQARSEFHRMDPMEVIATEQEVVQLWADHPQASCLLFPEDRRCAIRMFDNLPLKWAKSGPSTEFRGEAQPGEYYPFQIGVWAARRSISNLSLEFGGLRNESGKVIPAQGMTCFNLTGTDWRGRPMRKTVDVPKGQVRPLWMGVQIPKDGSGTYRGTITVKPSGAELRTVKVQIKVSGPVLEDGGVSDLWRLSRLKWLNSTLALDDEVIPPYTPLRVRGDTVECLGRSVRFGRLGLPKTIVSKGRDILAAPVQFVVETARGALRLDATRTRVTKVSPGAVERVTEAEGVTANVERRTASLTVRSRMEFDGCILYAATLEAKADLDLKDVRLEIPLKQDVAKYMMGLGKRGGFRSKEWRWKWDINRANNQVWLGDADGGLQLELPADREGWDVTTLNDLGLPPSWHNDGKGGCDIIEVGKAVVVRAYSGERMLRRGEELEFRFRFLITPFKPIDPRHWNWRYGDVNGDGNVLHVHHATPENPYINYPFIEAKRLAETVRNVKSIVKRTDFGKLTYPAQGNVNLRRGALHVWVKLSFDPKEGTARDPRYNQGLFSLDFPNDDQVGFYWNIDDRGMRTYIRKGPPTRNQYPILFGTSLPDWERGQRHVLTLSWGEQLAIFVDGKLKNAAPFQGTLDNLLQDVTMAFSGEGFLLDSIKISDAPFAEGAPPTPIADEHTLLLDTFSKMEGTTKTLPEKIAPGGFGQLAGTIRWNPGVQGQELHLVSRVVEGQPNGVNLYYTIRELSNHVAEMWPLRSLGDEVFQTRTNVTMKVGDVTFGQEGGGYPWLKEHLVSGYVPDWRQPLPWLEDQCAAIATQGLSRWHNYYVEGMQWLMRNTGIDGLYLDGIGYDRETMKRIAKVMQRNNPNYRINFHSGDNWSPPWDADRRVSPANKYMEHFPYISNLWFGELYDYNMPPDYWLVEISGIPFGLTGEMLNYETGGNPYRGMVYGMTSRQHASAPYMWRFWDEFGIQDAEWLGYWSPKCPVKTDRPDVLATVYRKPGKSLIALAHWPAKKVKQKAVVGKATTAPTVDGKLSPGEWDAAAKLTNFTVHDGDALAADQTEVFVTHDAERLYIGFRCANPGGKLKADAKERDGMTWVDDAIEFFVQPDLNSNIYYQFVGNSAGVYYDGKGLGGGDWNGDWTYRTYVGEGQWEGELSIPLSSVRLDSAIRTPQSEIGFNVCRDQQSPRQQASCWSPITGSFHNTDQFGRLTLTATQTPTRQTPADASKQTIKVCLSIDWKALGLNPAKAKLTAPRIDFFQNAAEFSPKEPIAVESAKGWLLVVHE